MIRLNLGAGDDRRKGFISVDLRPEVADVVCDVRKLEMYADESVDEILADDVLEHFPVDQTTDLLAEWRRVLRPGGRLTVRVPNLYLLCRGIAGCAETRNWARATLLIRNIYGGHKYGPEGSLDAHHTGWLPEMLHQALRDAGFDVVRDDGALNNSVIVRKR
jgi:SAM-dependent methyltransferase